DWRPQRPNYRYRPDQAYEHESCPFCSPARSPTPDFYCRTLSWPARRQSGNTRPRPLYTPYSMADIPGQPVSLPNTASGPWATFQPEPRLWPPQADAEPAITMPGARSRPRYRSSYRFALASRWPLVDDACGSPGPAMPTDWRYVATQSLVYTGYRPVKLPPS